MSEVGHAYGVDGAEITGSDHADSHGCTSALGTRTTVGQTSQRPVRLQIFSQYCMLLSDVWHHEGFLLILAAVSWSFFAATPAGLIAELPGFPGEARGLLQFKSNTNSFFRSLSPLELRNIDLCQLATVQV